MAKGDDQRARNQLDYQGKLAQNHLNNLRTDTIVPQNQQMWNNYTSAVDQNKADYGNIMGGYQSYLGENPYGEFIKSGGYSPQDIASIRARAIAPTRAVYQNSMNDINRQKRLGGGYAPNAIAARAKMGRDLSSSLSDANTNAEGMIAQLINQGKQFGTSGEVGRQLQTRGAMSNLYGTAPGMASTFGNQALQSTAQQLDLANLQNQLGLGISGRQIEAGQLQGKNQQLFNNILNAGKVASGFFTE